jgi:hypothetical protein
MIWHSVQAKEWFSAQKATPNPTRPRRNVQRMALALLPHGQGGMKPGQPNSGSRSNTTREESAKTP